MIDLYFLLACLPLLGFLHHWLLLACLLGFSSLLHCLWLLELCWLLFWLLLLWLLLALCANRLRVPDVALGLAIGSSCSGRSYRRLA